jgi:hypothetical protein
MKRNDAGKGVERHLVYLRLHLERYNFCAGKILCSVMQAAYTKCVFIVVVFMSP